MQPSLLTQEQHKAALSKQLEAFIERECPPSLIPACLETVRNILPNREWSYVQYLIGEDIGCTLALPSLNVATELILIGAYVKDDILDKTQSRYGVPTIVAQEGPGSAALVSDTLLCFGFAQLLQLLPEVRATLLVRDVLSGYVKYCQGQLQQGAFPPLESALLRTGELAGRLVALPACAMDSPRAHAFLEFGRMFGARKQMLNDLIDILGDPMQISKPVLEDLSEGRSNFLIDIHRTSTSISDRTGNYDIVQALYGSHRPITPIEQQQVVECLRDSGALEAGLSLYYIELERALGEAEVFQNMESRRILCNHLAMQLTQVLD